VIAVLFAGFFLLEGFDFGVGMLIPFLGKNDSERRTIMNAIGPFWDGNEVWLITAAGAMFAAFPNWYATLLSGFYIPLFLLLAALIVRGAGFEFRSKRDSQRWRSSWDWAICISSALPGFLWGVTIANWFEGLPIDAHMNYVGTLWHLFNPDAILTGLVFTAMFLLHGAVFLSLKTDGKLLERALTMARRLWVPTVILAGVFVVSTAVSTGLYHHTAVGLVSLLAAIALLLVGWFVVQRRSGWAFAMSALTILTATLTICLGLFPNVMISSLNPAWSLNIYNAASNPYALTVISWIALTIIPFVIAYQAWNYWIFRRRVSSHHLGHY
jgi:cytochrome d ubiquinol oxidase subunit II